MPTLNRSSSGLMRKSKTMYLAKTVQRLHIRNIMYTASVTILNVNLMIHYHVTNAVETLPIVLNGLLMNWKKSLTLWGKCFRKIYP